MIERLPSRSAAAVASLAFTVGSLFSYTAVRLYELGRSGPVDPSLILMSAHAAYPWRVLVATWAGGFCALAALIMLGTELPASRRRRLARLGVLASALAALLLAAAAVRAP